MNPRGDPLPANPYANALDAEFTLAHIDMFDDLYELWRTETVGVLKKDFAESYRETLGFEPELRDALIPVLRAANESEHGSDATIEELIADVRRRCQMNGSGASAGRASGDVGDGSWASWI